MEKVIKGLLVIGHVSVPYLVQATHLRVVTIDHKMISSWEQGFDADDNQVWDATKGPYIFKKY